MRGRLIAYHVSAITSERWADLAQGSSCHNEMSRFSSFFGAELAGSLSRTPPRWAPLACVCLTADFFSLFFSQVFGAELVGRESQFFSANRRASPANFYAPGRYAFSGLWVRTARHSDGR